MIQFLWPRFARFGCASWHPSYCPPGCSHTPQESFSPEGKVMRIPMLEVVIGVS
jgi:hypothetical protein